MDSNNEMNLHKKIHRIIVSKTTNNLKNFKFTLISINIIIN